MKPVSSSETLQLAFPLVSPPPPEYVSYGLSYTEALTQHAKQTFAASRVYIIASTSLSRQTSYVSDLEAALGPLHVATWTGVRPHTPWDDLIPIVNDMREKEADLLVMIGGNSLVDGAKIIIYALANGVKTLSDMEKIVELTTNDSAGTGKYFRDRSEVGNAPTVPIVCMPTTLSGSEYTKFAGATNPTTHLKTIMTHPKMYPSLVILDPTLCLTTPQWVWLSTGVRAIDHCVEAFCSLDCPADVQETAPKAFGLLVANLLKTKADPSLREPRLACHLAANGSTMSLQHMPQRLLVGASHGIGHQLGPLGVGHGETSCILLPAVLKYNKQVNGTEQEKLKETIWNCDAVVKEALAQAGLKYHESDLGDALDVVFKKLGMPRSLKDKGIGIDVLDMLAENSLKDPCCVTNPISLTKKEQVLEILQMVVG